MCVGVHVRVGGNGLICLCILTVFICAADAALMRNTFRLILLPHVAEKQGVLSETDTIHCTFTVDFSPFIECSQFLEILKMLWR